MTSHNVTRRHGNVRSTLASWCFGLHGIRNDVSNTYARSPIYPARGWANQEHCCRRQLCHSLSSEFHRGYAASTGLDLSSEDLDQRRPVHCPQRGSVSVYAIHFWVAFLHLLSMSNSIHAALPCNV